MYGMKAKRVEETIVEQMREVRPEDLNGADRLLEAGLCNGLTKLQELQDLDMQKIQ